MNPVAPVTRIRSLTVGARLGTDPDEATVCDAIRDKAYSLWFVAAALSPAKAYPGRSVTTDDNGLDIDLLAASLRADSSDLNAFVEALATKLEQAVPNAVRVQRRRDGMFGPKRVNRIALDAGDQRLELSAQDGRVQTRCARLSAGIVLKSETVATDAWLTVLSQALADEARSSQTTRQALERLLNA